MVLMLVNASNKGQVEPSASSFGYDERYYDNGYNNNKKNKDFDCIINNNNENRQVTSLPNPPSPTPSIDNNVYVVWTDDTPGNEEDILFASSTNNGQTFSSPPDNLSNNTGRSDEPQISSSTS